MTDTQRVDVGDPPPPGPPGRRRSRIVLAAALVVVLVAVLVVVVHSLRGQSGATTSTPKSGAPLAAPSSAADGQSAGVRYSWPLVADDEFDGNSLDTTLWGAYTGRTTGNVGKQSPKNIGVSDGVMTINSHGDSSAGMAWSTNQTYGRWEVRARSEPGVGYSPVALLWPESDSDWPQAGEIDFMEIPDPTRTVNHFTVHYGSDNSQDATTQNGYFSGWHDYAVEWEPDHITGYIDGKQVFSTTNKAEIPSGPMHLAIQQDIGPIADWIPAPDSTTPSDVGLQVDWVHIYGP
jgi:beta-glucanase (GH16 family)